MRFINLILRNPFRNKTRSILSIIGIAIGIATIVALGLITTGMENSVQSTFNEGVGPEITVSNSTSIGGLPGLLSSDYIEKLENMSNVTDAIGVLTVTDASSDDYSPQSTVDVNGVDASKLNVIGIKNINGTVFSNNSKEIIVGRQHADIENLSIGDNITVLGEKFEIVGIFETGNMISDSEMYTSISTLENLTDTKGKYSQILLKTTENANDTIISDKIEDKYSGLSTITSEEMSSILDDIINVLDTASLAISALAIIVGGIGIINTMIMTVYERTKEIGVLKSVGWKSRRILLMILGETLVLTILSGIVGSIFGILVSEIGVRFLSNADFSLGYSLHTFVLAFSIAIVVGIIGGLYPAYKASKLAPTEALRYE